MSPPKAPIALREFANVGSSAWFIRAYKFLSTVPQLPVPPRFSPNQRMYAYFEARAWIASNLMWLEESAQLLADAKHATTQALPLYNDGFPPPPEDVAIPNALLLKSKGPKPPAYDESVITRARFFRYNIDNAILRISSAFQKTTGLLASYYSIELPYSNQAHPDSKLFAALKERWPDDPLLEKDLAILTSEAFRQGQQYRNPRIHGLGASFRALYGGSTEILEAIVLAPFAVGIKPRQVVTAEELLALTRDFYREAVAFLRTSAALIQAHPLTFTKERPFLARQLHNPMMHRSRDQDKTPSDYTDVFRPTDPIYCSATVNRGGGEHFRIVWKFHGRSPRTSDMTIPEPAQEEFRITAFVRPDAGDAHPVGPASVEFWLRGKRVARASFRVVPD